MDSIKYLTIGLILSMSSVVIFAVSFVYAQNGTIVYNPATPGINSVTQLFIAIGGIIGTIGTILASLGYQRTSRAAKYMQTFGTKTKDIAFDNYKLMQAINIGSGGQIEMTAVQYQSLLDDARRRALAAEEQIKYLNPKKYLPNNPDEDTAMPREKDMNV